METEVIKRKESIYLKGRIERGQVVVEIHPDIKVGYSRQFNYVRVIKNGDDEPMRTEVVPDGYTLSQFIDDCYRFHCIFNNI